MPLYDFQVLDRQSGEVLEVIAVNLPIAKRDDVEFRRITVPQRVTVLGSAPDNPNNAHRVDMKNLHKSEERLGSNFEQFYGKSKKEIQRLWEPKQAV